jgi:hypothetical protein
MISARFLASEALFGTSFRAEFEIYEDGVLTTPSSVSISLYNPSESLIVIREASISQTTKKATAIFTSGIDGEINSISEDWRFKVDYEIGSFASQANFLFDSCRTVLQNTVVDDDLLKIHPGLDNDRWADQINFDPQIQAAFEEIQLGLKALGRRASLMVDATQIKHITVTKALEIVYHDFAKSTEDIWWNRYQKQMAKYAGEFANLNLKYDSDESGGVDSKISTGNINLVR